MSALLAQAPALPLDEAGEYVAAAYIVFVVLLVIYVGLMAAKLGRISRDLEELATLAERKQQIPGSEEREKVTS
jgi:hypothetical protein